MAVHLRFFTFQRAIPADGSGHASLLCCHALELSPLCTVRTSRSGRIDFVKASANILTWLSRSTATHPRRVNIPDSCELQCLQPRVIVSALPIRFLTFYLVLSSAPLRSGVPPNSCSLTPKHASSWSDTVRASQSSWTVFLSFHTVSVLNRTLECVRFRLQRCSADALQRRWGEADHMYIVIFFTQLRGIGQVMNPALLRFETFFICKRRITVRHHSQVLPIDPVGFVHQFRVLVKMRQFHGLVCQPKVWHCGLCVAKSLQLIHLVSKVSTAIPRYPRQRSCHGSEACQFLLRHNIRSLTGLVDWNWSDSACILLRIDLDCKVIMLREPASTVPEASLFSLSDRELPEGFLDNLPATWFAGEQQIIHVSAKHCVQVTIFILVVIQRRHHFRRLHASSLHLGVHAQVETSTSVDWPIDGYSAEQARFCRHFRITKSTRWLPHQKQASEWLCLEIRVGHVTSLEA